MALSWPALEDAMQAWLVASTGLGAGAVLWAKQPGAPVQVARPYATLRVAWNRTVSWDDTAQWSTDLTRPEGEEVKQETTGQREFLLRCEVVTAVTLGDTAAFALASLAQDSLLRESVRDTFRAAGLVVVDWHDVVDVGALLETAWEGRAQLEVRFRVSDKVDDFFGYIATAEVDGDYS